MVALSLYPQLEHRYWKICSKNTKTELNPELSSLRVTEWDNNMLLIYNQIEKEIVKHFPPSKKSFS